MHPAGDQAGEVERQPLPLVRMMVQGLDGRTGRLRLSLPAAGQPIVSSAA